MQPRALARVLHRILAASLLVPGSALSSACGAGGNGPSAGSGSGGGTGSANSGAGATGASTGSELPDASTGSTGGSGSQTGSSGGSSDSQSGSSGNPGGTGSADGGFSCNTQANPGCNCPNAGAPFAYTLLLEGNPGACGLSATATQNSQALCGHLCGGCFSLGASCQLTTPDSGASVQCNATCPPAGRRPPGLAPFEDAQGATLGRYFARCAHLEAASVAAFRVLRGELARHEAPAWMLRATERAARDEARHARATERIARRYGGSPRRPRIQRSPPRSLEALAIDNAIEGCVRETYGAAVAMWQAQRARDPKVRAAMERIAGDETRHAALSWQIARWAERRLAAEDRARNPASETRGHHRTASRPHAGTRRGADP